VDGGSVKVPGASAIRISTRPGWWIVRPEMSMKNRVFGVTGVFVGTDSL
jgi:hypothetical protein